MNAAEYCLLHGLKLAGPEHPAILCAQESLSYGALAARLSDLKAKLEQLAMDARRSPQRIFRAHPPDQRAQIRVDLRSTSKRAGFPTPVATEAGPMPTHERLGPDDLMVFRTDGNHRYSRTNSKRSPFVSWTRPRTFRRNTIS